MADPGAPGERATPGNVFTRKIGPLPMIAWVGIIGGGIVLWAYMKNRSSSQQSAAASSTPASDVPQWVNQTYTTVTAPSAQDVDQPPPVTSPPGGGGGTSGGGTYGVVNRGFHPYHPKQHTGRPGGKDKEPVFNATYVVKPGDTLASVAKRYKITREELAHANGYGTGAGLRTGEKLKVPSPAGTGTPNRAP